MVDSPCKFIGAAALLVHRTAESKDTADLDQIILLNQMHKRRRLINISCGIAAKSI
jgi:hypothetical protein